MIVSDTAYHSCLGGSLIYMYELNRPYTTKELCDALGIMPSTWKHNSGLYQAHLKKYFVVEMVPSGRWPKYKLVQEIKPWKTPIEEREEENRELWEDYRKATSAVVKQQPRNTITNIADTIKKYNVNGVNKYMNSDTTMRINTGKVLNENFTSGNGKWCEKIVSQSGVKYRVITQDEIDLLEGLKEEYKSQFLDKDKSQEVFTLYNQYQNGEITKAQLNKKYWKIYDNYYDCVMKMFKNVYGFLPVYVKEWKEKED